MQIIGPRNYLYQVINHKAKLFKYFKFLPTHVSVEGENLHHRIKYLKEQRDFYVSFSCTIWLRGLNPSIKPFALHLGRQNKHLNDLQVLVSQEWNCIPPLRKPSNGNGNKKQGRGNRVFDVVEDGSFKTSARGFKTMAKSCR